MFFSSCPLALRLQFFNITQFKRIMKRPTALRSLSFLRFHNIIDAPAVWYLCYLPALVTPPVCIPRRPTFITFFAHKCDFNRLENFETRTGRWDFNAVGFCRRVFIEFGENVRNEVKTAEKH